MNISFFDGVNDGKFYSINAGKYDELGEEDIDISTEVDEEDEDTGLPCEDCECLGLKELKEKITELEGNDFGDFEHMEKIDKELSTHLAMINKANMRLNQLNNKISDLKEFRDETYELQYGQLLDRLNLIEKKIDAFKCIDILDKVSHLYERLEKVEPKLEKLDMDVTSNMENLIDRIKKLEGRCDTDGKLIGNLGRHIVDTDCKLSSLSDKIHELDSKLAVTAQIVEDRVCTVDTINGPISGYDYAILSDRINELESKLGKLSSVEPTPIYYDNELKYFTTPGCAKGEIHDSVNHPSHYTDGKYETIDFIEEYGTITHIGNAIKYASRAGKKDEDAYIEDLKKGLWYLHRYNCPPKKKHIDVLDYCKEKKLSDELTNVLIAISRENYVEAERVLRKYIEELKK